MNIGALLKFLNNLDEDNLKYIFDKVKSVLENKRHFNETQKIREYIGISDDQTLNYSSYEKGDFIVYDLNIIERDENFGVKIMIENDPIHSILSVKFRKINHISKKEEKYVLLEKILDYYDNMYDIQEFKAHLDYHFEWSGIYHL